ncbi:hypothetical protein Bra1253DRAFT_06022 [Bradyrhizobium sp. WSM1253]|nr:hypothetical protein Bra1253DRAFT_06022 [Bradyrhizobium sp. WSM1253]
MHPSVLAHLPGSFRHASCARAADRRVSLVAILPPSNGRMKGLLLRGIHEDAHRQSLHWRISLHTGTEPSGPIIPGPMGNRPRRINYQPCQLTENTGPYQCWSLNLARVKSWSSSRSSSLNGPGGCLVAEDQRLSRRTNWGPRRGCVDSSISLAELVLCVRGERIVIRQRVPSADRPSRKLPSA